MDIDNIYAPFTDEQVKNLNEFQAAGYIHPYTCGNDHDGDRILIATNAGWICPSCNYTQNYCSSYMADGTALKNYREELKNLGFFKKSSDE